MLAEQVIAKGSGYFFNLNDVLQRRLNILPLEKDVRKSFWGFNPKRLFSLDQIEYSAEDTEHLGALKDAQMVFIDEFNYHKDLFEIEFPYTSIVGDAELEGFLLNEPVWAKLAQENEVLRNQYQNELNHLLRKLRIDYPDLERLRINKTVKFNKAIQLDAFGDDRRVTAPTNSNVNYSSDMQIMRIFDLMSLPIPQLKKKDPKTKVTKLKNSVSGPALEKYLIDHPDTPLTEVINNLIKYSKANIAVTTFGDRFLVEFLRREKGKKPKRGYKRLSTGKIYTNYKQCGTETTRMSSGGEKDGYYNSQNIPKNPKYRNCFLADPGTKIITIDLSGAELVIAASLSRDRKLIELITKGDIHSTLSNYCYQAIINYMKINMREYRLKDELYDLLKANSAKLDGYSEADEEQITKHRVKQAITGNFVVNQAEANDIRDKFKNVNYSMIYGGSAERIMEILNIPNHYASIVEVSLRDYLPVLFDYLDRNARFGVQNGYIRFNEICGGRHWFKDILWCKSNGMRPTNKIIGATERACKNYPIQATQGQMLKEATVRYYYDHVYPFNIPVVPKLWVHDEFVCMAPEDIAEKEAKTLQGFLNTVSTSYLLGELEMQSHYQVLDYWTK